MAIRGAKPKPTRLKILTGNPGRHRINQSEPRPAVVSPQPPAYAGREIKGFYKRNAQMLADLGVMTTADVDAFELMATHFGIAIDAAKRIRKEGLTREDDDGIERKHPLLQVLRDNSTAFRAYAVEFGMTPSSRSRVHLAAEARQLDLVDLLFGDAVVADGEKQA